MEYLEAIASAFRKYIGDDAIDRLRAQLTSKPMLLIAGDQLTGKSTLARTLAGHYSGIYRSVGALFREAAARRGLTIAEQARRLRTERGLDVEIDYATCEMIAGRKLDGELGVIEGRQPAYLGHFMATLGKEELARVFFACTIRQQATRFLRREVGEEAYELAEAGLAPEYESLEAAAADIRRLALPDIHAIARRFIDNQHRDTDDRERYLKLYGFDYRDPAGYDVVIDTTGRTAEQNLARVLERLAKLDARWA